MTAQQEAFVTDVITAYDQREWPHNLLVDLVPALMRQDEAEVARVIGLMLIELRNAGERIRVLAGRWIELFGEIADAERRLTVQ